MLRFYNNSFIIFYLFYGLYVNVSWKYNTYFMSSVRVFISSILGLICYDNFPLIMC